MMIPSPKWRVRVLVIIVSALAAVVGVAWVVAPDQDPAEGVRKPPQMTAALTTPPTRGPSAEASTITVSGSPSTVVETVISERACRCEDRTVTAAPSTVTETVTAAPVTVTETVTAAPSTVTVTVEVPIPEVEEP